jgi:hypothetical protein
VNNIDYSHDSPVPILPDSTSGLLDWYSDYWRTPEETIEDETGDCEDMAILLTSLLRSYNKRTFAVWCINIRSETPSTSGHVAVAFPVADGHIAILDPAGNYYTGISFGRLSSELVSTEINKWLLHWDDKIPNAWIKAVFSDNMYKEFSSTSEFLEWFSNQ